MRTCSIGGRERQFPISVYQPLACTPQTLSELMAEWDYEPEGTGGLAFYGRGSEFMRSQAICEEFVVAADEGPGLIEGTVIYEDGRPAKGATALLPSR